MFPVMYPASFANKKSAKSFEIHNNKHQEAYCVMRYESKDGSIVEYLWNSRDGVTPFCIPDRDWKMDLTHTRFNEDKPEPYRVPKVGDRIFVNLTKEKARGYATKKVEKFWDHPIHPISQMFETKEEAIERFAKESYESFGAGMSPDIVEVTPELHEEFKRISFRRKREKDLCDVEDQLEEIEVQKNDLLQSREEIKKDLHGSILTPEIGSLIYEPTAQETESFGNVEEEVRKLISPNIDKTISNLKQRREEIGGETCDELLVELARMKKQG